MSFARRPQREHITADFAFPRPAPRIKEKPGPKKRKAIAWKSARRIEREAVYGPFQDWLHASGAICVVCGTGTNIQAAHVGLGGVGMKHGSAADQIRLCGANGRRIGCHAEYDQYRGFFMGWTNERRQAWSREQRLVHWEAFRSAAGIALTSNRAGMRVTIEEWLACDAAIAERLDQLRIGG